MLSAMSPALASLHDDIEKIAAEANIPAVAWVIKLPGQAPVTGTLGKGASPVSADTPFRFGSITKSFTAIALLKAAASKGLDPATPAREILPADLFDSPFPQPVRILDLAALTAGHTDVGFEAFDDNTAYPLAEALRRNRTVFTSRWPPGLLHSYTNATPGLSAKAIEVLTGQTYPEAMRSLLFEPLGLKQASFDDSASLPGGFRADGNTPIPYWNVTFQAFGGLNLSINDMAVFLTTLLNRGSTPASRGGNVVWSHGIHERLLQPVADLPVRAGLKIGYGPGVYSRLRRGITWYGHGGDADGYRSRYAFLPEDDAGYAVVINTDNPDALVRLERLLEKAIAQALPVKSVAPLVTAPADPAFDGEYYPATIRFGREAWMNCNAARAWIRADGALLRVRVGDRRHELVATAGQRFVRKGESEPVMALVRDADGVVWFTGELGNFVRIATRATGPSTPLPPFLPRCIPE